MNLMMDGDKILSVAEKIAVLFAAVVAAIKFGTFEWRERHKTEMECICQVADNNVIFEARYRIANTGDRALRVKLVRLELCPAKGDVNLQPDRDPTKFLVPPTVIAKDKQEAKSSGHFDVADHFKPMGTLGHIKKGEGSTFTLRCQKKDHELPDVFFVVGEFWKRKRLFLLRSGSSFSHMFVKASK
jgi:hypothetical protein